MTAKCRPVRRQSTAIVSLGGWENGAAALWPVRNVKTPAGFAGAYIALSTIPNTGITVSIEQKAATPSFGMIFIGTSIFKMADPTSSTHLRFIYVASQYVASAKKKNMIAFRAIA
jgi:cytochrome b561